MKNLFRDTFTYKVIYLMTIDDELHKGCVKVGDAKLETTDPIDHLTPNSRQLNQAAKKRIDEYTRTAAIPYQLHHTELAVRNEINSNNEIILKAFRDYQVHDVLENSGFQRRTFDENSGREWFEVDISTALEAIQATKQNRPNISQTALASKYTPIVYRPEQKEAIKMTIKQFKKGDRMLWNAKMRFGKTLSALKVVKEFEFKRTIVLTHRPVVNKGWYEDFKKTFYDRDDYEYGSKYNGVSLENLIRSDVNFVYFASIQDLRESSQLGGRYDKNDEVFDLDWDLVVVDEAHEGTTTALGEDVIKNVVKEGNGYTTKFLALSGTPFNILDRYEDNIYTWDYIMEQRSKAEWDELHFGDSNPYDELPQMNIYTYDLGESLTGRQYKELEDRAFNFREFFRVWTGDVRYDKSSISEGKQIGDFYHEEDVLSFLNLITKSSDESNYPYSTEEYRDLFRHSLWMLPGVKEAKALSKLLKAHPVFGSGMFEIVNVAGDGDEDEESKEALSKVQSAIRRAGENYTITLSCGKLTTGVTVPEWTAVFMLAGSYSTSASNYLQTIFRVQSPCNINGKIKQCCYVFDFAPDRSLKMVAEAATISTRAGKTNETDRIILGEFLNYCPVISIDGTRMREYDTGRMLQQLKRAYAQRAVKNGFDDTSIYNDELLKLDEIELKEFQKLKKIVGSSKAAINTSDIDINHQGFTDEEYEEIERINRKKKIERTPEEEALLEEIKQQKAQRRNAISILRAISIRIPLLIYGANISINEDITMEKLVDIVDDSSWQEFMPSGVDKSQYKKFTKYYDQDVFIAAGRQIRNIALSADELLPEERIQRITNLISCFKNPDKETVLTPWRVVNMHLSSCLGGYCFYDAGFYEIADKPRRVDIAQTTSDTLANPKSRILEINSKSGLYPLYATYSLYRTHLERVPENNLTIDIKEQIWDKAIQENIFIICKTPMAKAITQRTLVGYRDVKINAHYFDDLNNMLKNKPDAFANKVTRPRYWKLEGEDIVKFDAVVGNPPYAEETGSSTGQKTAVFNLFVENGLQLKPRYLSMITPSRWFAGGMGLDAFRNNMMNDKHISKIYDYVNSKELFTGISISGGVSFFLWDQDYSGECEFTNVINGTENTMLRSLNEFFVLVRYNEGVSVLRKIKLLDNESISQIVSPLSPFGLPTNYRGRARKTSKNTIALHSSAGVSYISKDEIPKGLDLLDRYNVLVSKTSSEHAGEPDKDGMFKVMTSSMKVIEPGEACTHSYFVIGSFENKLEAENLHSYLKTKFVRFLIQLSMSSINLSKNVFTFVPMQDFSQPWTDDILFRKYKLDKDEIAFIESLIKPMI